MTDGMHGDRAFYERSYSESQYAASTTVEEHAYGSLVQAFVNAHRLRDKRCLEIGCGRGAFQDLVEDYLGADVATALGKFMHKPFVVCSATQLPFGENTFDAVWTVTVLEHVPDPEEAFREIRRVLRPGGHLLLAPAWFTRPWFAEGLPMRRYRELTWRQKLLKLSIPLRDSPLIRYPWIMARRFFRLLRWAAHGRKPTAFRYRKLKPNYERYWMSDSDAVNSMDPFDAILWFVSRGDACLNCPTPAQWLRFRGPVLEFRVEKRT